MYNLELINGEISVKEAHEMVKAFDAANPGKTKSVWFSLQRIESMLTLLYQESLRGAGTNGIRLYFGQYPEDYDQPKEWAGKNTVIFVSTYLKDKMNVDYFKHLPVPPPMFPENKGEICPPPSDCGNNGSRLLEQGFDPTKEE
jgi:hypothetical protein